MRTYILILINIMLIFSFQLMAQYPANEHELFDGLKKHAIQSKQIPSPNGIGGEYAEIGSSISIDGDNMLVGARTKAILFKKIDDEWTELKELITVEKNREVHSFWHEVGFASSVKINGNTALVNDYYNKTGVVHVFSFIGNNWFKTQELSPSDGAYGDQFGFSLEMTDSQLIIGAPLSLVNGVKNGAVYVFELENGSWVEKNKIISPDEVANSQFGVSLALNDGELFIGRPGDAFDSQIHGSVYVYNIVQDQWQQSDVLMASDSFIDNEFGYSLSVRGQTLAIGNNRVNSAQAYVFEKSNGLWSQTARLLPDSSSTHLSYGFGYAVDVLESQQQVFITQRYPYYNGNSNIYVFNKTNQNEWEYDHMINGTSGIRFGESILSDNDTFFVGSPSMWNDGVSNTGGIQIYQNNLGNWINSNEILASDSGSGDKFGTAVSLSSNWALIGADADNNDGLGNESGAAYFFENTGSTWINQIKVTGSDDSEFGTSVSMDENWAVIGSPGESTGIDEFGAAYVYHYADDNWVEFARLSGDDLNEFGGFAQKVDIQNGRVAIAAPKAGAVYIYDLDVEDNEFNLTAKIVDPNEGVEHNSFGTSISLSGNRLIIGGLIQGEPENCGITCPPLVYVDGYAYIFEYDGLQWNEMQKLQIGPGSHLFGSEVKIEENRLLVAAPHRYGSSNGFVNVYDYDGQNWQLHTQVNTNSSFPQYSTSITRSFGRSIELQGDTIYIFFDFTFPFENLEPLSWYQNSAVLEYKLEESWNLHSVMQFDYNFDNQYFAKSISVSSSNLLVGDSNDHQLGKDSGASYFFLPDVIFADEF